MLVLTRDERNSDILIGDNIVVRVVRVKGNQVKLGIEAPQSVPVDRREVRERKEDE